MNSTNDNNYFKPKCKGSKYSGSSEEYYEKGLEILNPSMKKFFNSLKLSPKVLFVKLHKNDKHSSNGCLYKLRNKSTIQFLTPSEVKQIAKQDVELMYNIMKKKILSLGKLNTINFNNTVNGIEDSETFFKKNKKKNNNNNDKNFVHRIEENSTLPTLTCVHCNKKFLTLISLKHHMSTRHLTDDVDDDFDKNCNRNPPLELSVLKQNKLSPNNDLSSNNDLSPNNDLSSNLKFLDLETKTKIPTNNFSCDVLCCACLKIIIDVRPFLDSLVNNIYLPCLYCQSELSVVVFLNHIATKHLPCKLDECHSKLIDNGYKLRQVLTMENEFECIHVDCDHYYFIDLNEPNISVTVDNVDLNQIINNENENLKIENEELENNLENSLENSLENNLENSLENSLKNGLENGLENENTEHEINCEIITDSLEEKIHLRCSVCEKNFQHEQKLLRHLFIKHRFTYPFTCDICFFSFKSEKELEIHVQKHKPEIDGNFELTTEEISTETETKITSVQEEKINVSIIKEKEEEEKHPSKMKISCIVEKVEYPLDIHNLYAHIRKANDPTEINSSELRLETSFNNSNNMESPKKCNLLSEEKVNKNFECEICGKKFNSQRPFSEHLFFTHDVEFQESVVLDFLKSNEDKNLTTNNSVFNYSTQNLPLNNQKNVSKKRKRNITENNDNLRIQIPKIEENFEMKNKKNIKILDSQTTNSVRKRNTNSTKIDDKIRKFKLEDLKKLKKELVMKTNILTSENIKIKDEHPCCDCNKIFLTKSILEKHKRLMHQDKKIAGFLIKNPILKAKSINCPICNLIFPSQQNLKAHLMVYHERVTDSCQLCDKLFSFGRGVRHILDFHIIPYCENVNKKNFELFKKGNSIDDVNETIRVLGEKRLKALCSYSTFINEDTYKCQNCQHSTTAIYYYRNHYLQTHEKFCILCNLSFQTNIDFLQHLKLIHHSSKHYLWFIDTLISTILMIGKNKDNSFESFQDIIMRKFNEEKFQSINDYNQMNAHNLPLVTDEKEVTKLDESYNNVLLPDFCMECEISENGTLVMQNDNGIKNPIILSNFSDINEQNKCETIVNNSNSLDISNCILDYPIIISDDFINNLQNDKILTDANANNDNNHIFADVQLNGEEQ